MGPQSRLIKIKGNIIDSLIFVCLCKLILFKQHNPVKLFFSEEDIKLVILYVNSIQILEDPWVLCFMMLNCISLTYVLI